MVYIKNKNNPLEQFLKTTETLHDIEDYLRDKLLSSEYKLTYDETLILARILWGRISNSNKELNRILDPRHAKAQMITIVCIVFYLYYQKIPNTILYKNKLYILFSYHMLKIEKCISNWYNIEELPNYSNNYFDYCQKWKDFCNTVLHQKSYDLNNINKEHNNMRLSVYRYNNKSRFIIDDKLSTFLLKIKIDDFISL